MGGAVAKSFQVLEAVSAMRGPVRLSALADELDCIDKGKRFPIFITHTKPAETELIMTEIQRFDQTQPFGPNVSHDIRWLRAGQEFEL